MGVRWVSDKCQISVRWVSDGCQMGVLRYPREGLDVLGSLSGATGFLLFDIGVSWVSDDG